MPTAAPITLEGNGLFARMLQHETGHLDGFLYLDRLVGRHARAAKRAVKSNGWGVPGAVVDCRARDPTRSATDACRPLPSVGTRVSIRYRLPAGSDEPMTDVVGHLEAVDARAGVRTKSDGRGRCRSRRRGQRPRALACPGAHLARSARLSTPRRWPGRAPNSNGWPAGFCGPAAASPAGPIRLSPLIFQRNCGPARRSSTGTAHRGLPAVAGVAGAAAAGARDRASNRPG